METVVDQEKDEKKEAKCKELVCDEKIERKMKRNAGRESIYMQPVNQLLSGSSDESMPDLLVRGKYELHWKDRIDV